MARKPVGTGYKVRLLTSFLKDFKRIAKHPEYDRETLKVMADDFAKSAKMPAFYREHALDGEGRKVDWTGYSSVDLSPDIRVIFIRNEPRREVVLHRIGSHAQLYG